LVSQGNIAAYALPCCLSVLFLFFLGCNNKLIINGGSGGVRRSDRRGINDRRGYGGLFLLVI